MLNNSLKNKTAAFHNLGCKVNYYETEKMKQELAECGVEIVDFTEAADIYVINTCSVTAVADKKSRQMIHRAKKKSPDSVVVACGCFVQKDMTPDEIDCDIIVGNDEKSNLKDVLFSYFEDNVSDTIRHDINATGEEFEDMFKEVDGSTSFDLDSHTRAFIKIQDGCNEFCTYCIIPYVRGRIRSRKRESILSEINTLVSSGVKEVVLTGIHVTSYDDSNDGDSVYGLAELCEDIDANTGLLRLRLSSLEPRIITEDFAGRLSKIKSICPHFHLSLQSGCDATIKRMNRKYTTDDFMKAVEILRKYFDHPAITTDIITGFPGETDEEFECTFDFVKKVGFADLHVFPFSAREGTPAAKMQGAVKKSVKHERSERLIELGKQMSYHYRQYFDDKDAEVLFEESDIIEGRRTWSGYSREYIKYNYVSDKDLRNEILTVRRNSNA